MDRDDRDLVHAAIHIAERVRRSLPAHRAVELPVSAWQTSVRLAGMIVRASGRGWLAAENRLRQQLAASLQSLVDTFIDIQRSLQMPTGPQCHATSSDIYRDLVALRGEFATVRYDRRRRELAVTTADIELDDLNLGSFEIALQCDRLGDASPYRVIALEPHYAGIDSDTTHPHVQRDLLCEGEGRIPIDQALQHGRLFDFFLVVQQVLKTYNPSSAYVAIDEWHGVTCRDCGTTTSADERDSCMGCEADLCGVCTCGCGRCYERFCDSCIDDCQACLECYCEACLRRCSKCDFRSCEDCLIDEKCPRCVEKEEEEAATDEANVAVHAVRVGEAALSA